MTELQGPSLNKLYEMLQPAATENTYIKIQLDGPTSNRTRTSRKLYLRIFQMAMTNITTIQDNLTLPTNLPTKLTQESVILVQVRNSGENHGSTHHVKT
jgi:hypothetical protein